jgi:matrixin/CARDB protein/slime mold repeat-containing protein
MIRLIESKGFLFCCLTVCLVGLGGFGCSGGTNVPVDGGDGGSDGDGGQIECTDNTQCDDDNLCTDDFCDWGKCIHNNNLAACDDGQQCSINDRCNNGVCVGQSTQDCDDDNECTEDRCDDTQGCVHIPNNASCDDDSACTIGETCAAGACQGGTPIECDDGNPCTDDTCDPSRGCVFTNNSAVCDDGQECSTNDHCQNGVCAGDSVRDCDDNNICTTDRCDDALGCVNSFNVAPCDDGNQCTENDACSQGSCTGGSMLDCDDDNECTTDFCNEQTGCVNNNNTDPCDDGNACTVNDTCANGGCVPGSARDCEDNNVCTDDSCNISLGCVNADNTDPCDDGDPCTDNDVCGEGECQPGASAFDCDDDNVCTDDDCDPDIGCTNTHNTDVCDDSDVCTMDDICSGGNCQGVPADLDGDNVVAEGCFGGVDCCDSGTEAVAGCTVATAAQINPNTFEGLSSAGTCTDGLDNDCDGVFDGNDPGCQACSGNEDCDNDDVCDGLETCVDNECQQGTPLDCEDDEICTNDSCDEVQGCQNVPNTLFCDDQDPCTVGDQCSGGSCQPGGDSLTCDDGEDCTDDSCVAGQGCVYTNDNSNSCTDDDPCTGGDYCSSGVCQSGSGAPDCDDENDCTDDTCVAGQGCVFTADDNNSCADGNACTENDHCDDGFCVGTAMVCDDANPCTDNFCDAQVGCEYPPNDGNSCVHGNECIVNDHCDNGFCIGDPRDLDDDTYGDEACGGDDCDDDDDQTYPGAPEICGDDKDNNCNYLADEGCDSCSVVDPNAELVIDNDQFGGGYMIDMNDEAINVFFVESTSYTVIQAKAAFLDFDCGNGGDQGQYSLHIYADDEGAVGAELASSDPVTVVRQGGCDPESDPQEIAWGTFILTTPVSFTQGQLFFAAIRSHQQEHDATGAGDGFIPITSPPVLVPYQGGFLFDSSEPGYYYTNGNWQLRVEGCGDGPWLELSAHSPASIGAGASSSIGTTLRNRGFTDATSVGGVLSCDEPEMVINVDTSSYGNITTGSTASNSPSFTVQPDASAYGIYGMQVATTDGVGNSWTHAFGLYVQGSGCTQDNHGLVVDNGTATYVIPLAANDMFGNYFAVDSTSFTMTAVQAQIYRTAGPSSSNFRVKIYSYLGGAPDQLLATTSWSSVSGDNVINHTFNLPTPLTFKENDTFFAFVESQSNLSTYEFFAPLSDDGSGDSWSNGVLWDQSAGSWIAIGNSAMIQPRGCQATELRYDSHTSNPASIDPGDSASLTITLANDGALAATNVTATLSSSDSDVTVTQADATYGTINAGQTDSASGYQISVSSGADEFQYLLDLEITDGVNTWNDVVPLRLAGGQVDLYFSEFDTVAAGNDIHYNFVVSNQGNVDCITEFQVDLYIDEESTPSTGQAGDWSESYSGLDMGDSITISLVLSDAGPGEYSAYVQADTLQAVSESSEANNIDGPSTVTIGTTDVFELLSPPRKWFNNFPGDPVEFRFVTGNSQPGLTQAEARNAFRNGFQHWEDVPTASITFNEEAETSNSGFRSWDGHNTMSFNDPDGELGTGTLAACVPAYDGYDTMDTNGVTFYRMTDADIVVNNGVAYGTNAEAGAGGCWSDPVTDIEGVATHEQGHLLGLDHPDVVDATMYYAIGPCDPSSVTLEVSDENGVTFIYP